MKRMRRWVLASALMGLASACAKGTSAETPKVTSAPTPKGPSLQQAGDRDVSLDAAGPECIAVGKSLHAAVQLVRPSLESCYLPLVEAQPDLSIVLETQIQVDGSGKPTVVELASPSSAPAEKTLAQCTLEKLKEVRATPSNPPCMAFFAIPIEFDPVFVEGPKKERAE